MGKTVEVILTETDKALGKFGEVKKVKAGFANNFLIPKKKALSNTRANRRIFEDLQKKESKEDAKRKESAEKSKKTLDGKELQFEMKAQKSGKLYGSITKAKISATIKKDLKVELEESQIGLEAPIKKTGTEEVIITLHDDVTVSIKVHVKASEKGDEKE